MHLVEEVGVPERSLCVGVGLLVEASGHGSRFVRVAEEGAENPGEAGNLVSRTEKSSGKVK